MVAWRRGGGNRSVTKTGPSAPRGPRPGPGVPSARSRAILLTVSSRRPC